MQPIRHKIVFCFLFFAFLFISACTEKNSWFKNADVNGVVIDTTTGGPIPDATVTLIRVETSSGTGWLTSGEITTPVMDTKTASGGSFKFKFRDKKRYTYRVEASKGNYFSSKDIIFGNNGQIINVSSSGRYRIYLIAKTNLNIHVKNVNPFDPNDYISVWADYRLYNMYTAYGPNAREFIGSNVDESWTAIVSGNLPAKIRWTVIKNQIYTSHDTDIYCPAFNTTNFNINY